MQPVIELYVQNKKVDIDNDSRIQIKRELTDLRRIGVKSKSLTRRFTVVNSRRTFDVFKNLYNINSVGAFDFQKRVVAEVRADNHVILRGFLIVEETGKDSYEVVVSTPDSELIGALGSALIQGNEEMSLDISFDGTEVTNHTPTRQYIRQSWANYVAGQSFIYPLVDHDNHLINDIDVPYQVYPALSAKKIFTKILENNGFSVSYSDDVERYINEMYIPYNGLKNEIVAPSQSNIKLTSFLSNHRNKFGATLFYYRTDVAASENDTSLFAETLSDGKVYDVGVFPRILDSYDYTESASDAWRVVATSFNDPNNHGTNAQYFSPKHTGDVSVEFSFAIGSRNTERVADGSVPATSVGIIIDDLRGNIREQSADLQFNDILPRQGAPEELKDDLVINAENLSIWEGRVIAGGAITNPINYNPDEDKNTNITFAPSNLAVTYPRYMTVAHNGGTLVGSDGNTVTLNIPEGDSSVLVLGADSSGNGGNEFKSLTFTRGELVRFRLDSSGGRWIFEEIDRNDRRFVNKPVKSTVNVSNVAANSRIYFILKYGSTAGSIDDYGINMALTDYISISYTDWSFSGERNENDFLPRNYKQRDFVQDILNTFYAFVDVDPTDSSKVTIRSYNDFIGGDDIPVIDLSREFEYGSEKIRFLANETAKSNNFIFASDDDDIYLDDYDVKFEETYGSLEVINPSEIATDESNIEFNYASTLMRRIGLSYLSEVPVITNSEDFSTEFTPRIMFARKYSQSGNQAQLAWGGDANSDTDDILTLNTEFDTNVDSQRLVLSNNNQYRYVSAVPQESREVTNSTIYNVFYRDDFQRRFSADSKLLEGNFVIPPYKFAQIGFNKRFYIQGFGLFRLESIKSYVANTGRGVLILSKEATDLDFTFDENVDVEYLTLSPTNQRATLSTGAGGGGASSGVSSGITQENADERYAFKNGESDENFNVNDLIAANNVTIGGNNAFHAGNANKNSIDWTVNKLDVWGNIVLHGGQIEHLEEVHVPIVDAFLRLNSGGSEVNSGIEVDIGGGNFSQLFRRASDNNWVIDGSIIALNDGTLQTNLNADRVDGLHGSQFLRSDVDDTTTGALTISKNDSEQLRLGFNQTGIDPRLSLYEGTAIRGLLQYIPSVNQLRLRNVETNNNLVVSDSLLWNSETVWHSGNDGAGSGLDADLLDGFQSSQFIRSDADDTATGQYTFSKQQAVFSGLNNAPQSQGACFILDNDGNNDMWIASDGIHSQVDVLRFSGATEMIIQSAGIEYIHLYDDGVFEIIAGNLDIGTLLNPTAISLIGDFRIFRNTSIGSNNLSGAFMLAGSFNDGVGIDSESVKSFGTGLTIGTVSPHQFYIITDNENRVSIDDSGEVSFYDRIKQNGTFVSGFAGDLWELNPNDNGDSHFTVDRLTVRGRIDVYELVINQIRATNGSLWVSDSIKARTATATNITVERDTVIPFQVNDIIRAQEFDGRNVRVYNARVTSVDNTAPDRSINVTRLSGTSECWDGATLVRIGNSSNNSRRGSIYLTSSDTGSPFIDILDGVTDASLAGHTRIRIGQLSGISGQVGYGIWGSRNGTEESFVISSGNASTPAYARIAGWSFNNQRLSRTFSNLNVVVGESRLFSGWHGFEINTDSNNRFNILANQNGTEFEFRLRTGGLDRMLVTQNLAHIAGWNFTNNRIFATSGSGYIEMNQASRRFLLTPNGVLGGSNFSFINMHFTSPTNWGINGAVNGNVLFQLGSTNQISGWTFNNTSLYRDLGNYTVSIGHEFRNRTSVRGFHVANESGNLARVSMGASGNEWGLWGTQNGVNIFRLGSENFIAGWDFDNNALTKTIGSTNLSIGIERYETGFTGFEVGTSANNRLNLHTNGSIYELVGRVDGSTYFRLTNSGASEIGGWLFDGTSFTSPDGRITLHPTAGVTLEHPDFGNVRIHQGGLSDPNLASPTPIWDTARTLAANRELFTGGTLVNSYVHNVPINTNVTVNPLFGSIGYRINGFTSTGRLFLEPGSTFVTANGFVRIVGSMNISIIGQDGTVLASSSRGIPTYNNQLENIFYNSQTNQISGTADFDYQGIISSFPSISFNMGNNTSFTIRYTLRITSVESTFTYTFRPQGQPPQIRTTNGSVVTQAGSLRYQAVGNRSSSEITPQGIVFVNDNRNYFWLNMNNPNRFLEVRRNGSVTVSG